VIRTCQAVAAALALVTPIHADAAPGPAKPAPVDLNDIVLPPESARHNALGMDAYRAEDYETAYRELKLAYEGLDVRADIDGRDMVLASLRTSLVRMYEKTGELKHLCLARKELLLHIESLLVAFGEDTDLQDIPGIKRRLRQIGQKISAHTPRLGEPGCDGRRTQVERPVPSRPRADTAPPSTPTRDRGRPARIVGVVSVSVGGVLLGAMTYALFMRRASDDGLRALADSTSTQPGGLLTREQRSVADSLLQVGSYHRTAAIATGISGGSLVLAGVSALAVSRVLRGRDRKLAVLPVPTRTGGALVLTARF
jgi:hypothetical protein